MTDLPSSTLINQSTSPLLRLPAELRNDIYVSASSSITLIRKKVNLQNRDLSVRDWNNAFRFENSNKGLSQTCRQLQKETFGYNEQLPDTLILPFDVDLDVLVYMLDARQRSGIRTIDINKITAKRFRGIASGNYMGRRVDHWKDEGLVKKTFPSLEIAIVRNVWRKIRNVTADATRSYLGQSDLKVEFR